MSHVSPEPNSGCWLWTHRVTGEGYAMYWNWPTKQWRIAHRHAYLTFVGPIPEGLHLDHLCRVRCCVNPDHLEPVTPLVNTRRSTAGWQNRAKTHCPRGHPYAGDNLFMRPRRDGQERHCRTCAREATRKSRAKRVGYASPLPPNSPPQKPGDYQKAKTHCRHGHPYSGDNLRMKGKERVCRECERQQRKRYWEQAKAAREAIP